MTKTYSELRQLLQLLHRMRNIIKDKEKLKEIDNFQKYLKKFESPSWKRWDMALEMINKLIPTNHPLRSQVENVWNQTVVHLNSIDCLRLDE